MAMPNFNDPMQPIRLEEFVAQQVHVYAARALTDYPALEHNLEVLPPRLLHNCEDMVMQLRSWMLAGRVPTNEYTETVRWPDGVWQMFKHLHMPEWFKRRWPVRMAERHLAVTTNHYFVCPHLVTDPRERHVHFMATGSDFGARVRGVQ